MIRLTDHYRRRFGCKIYKLGIDAGFTCPNRDGTLDTRGCSFCGADGGSAFVACGSAGERNCASRIGEKVINLAGRTTFAQLFEILRGASAVIGNDSGPLHAAAALKIPVFGFYGPTDPYLTGPWGKNCHFFFADCECAGCLKRICPDGSYHCWQLDADHVAGTVSEKLKN